MNFIFLAKISAKWNRYKTMYHGRPCTFHKWRIYAEAQLAGEWEGLTYPILKIKKSALTWGENALNVFIYELNFSFKMALFQKTFPFLENPWLSQDDTGRRLVQPKQTCYENIRNIRIKINYSNPNFHTFVQAFGVYIKNICKPQQKMIAPFRRLHLIYV